MTDRSAGERSLRQRLPLPFCLSLMILLLLSACPGELDNPEQFDMGLRTDDTGGDGGGDGGTGNCNIDVEQDLFVGTCGIPACHAAGAQNGDTIDLVTDPTMWVDADSPTCSGEIIIDSTNPNESFMLKKLRGTHPPTCGFKMPTGGNLTDDEIACVEDWIQEQIGN